MTVVKICGIITFADAIQAAEAGADMLGFNFYKKSPRYIEPDVALEIANGLRTQLGDGCPVLIGVFVNEVVALISVITQKVGLAGAQLSGDESDAMLRELRGISYKAIRPMNMHQALDDMSYFQSVFPVDERFPSLLLDAYHPKLYGGTGETAGTEVALAVRQQVNRLMLAGGLNPENITSRVQAIRPWGVDVASGVEFPDQPGVKDPARVMAFIQAAKSA
jgi:phosphoribosylanthranilate isomerase